MKQKTDYVQVIKERVYLVEIFSNDLNLIKSGEKQAEIRQWYKDLEGQDVGLINVETNKLELIITIGQVLNLKYLTEEERDLVLDEAKVDEEFRSVYPCNYLYTITGTKTIH